MSSRNRTVRPYVSNDYVAVVRTALPSFAFSVQHLTAAQCRAAVDPRWTVHGTDAAGVNVRFGDGPSLAYVAREVVTWVAANVVAFVAWHRAGVDDDADRPCPVCGGSIGAPFGGCTPGCAAIAAARDARTAAMHDTVTDAARRAHPTACTCDAPAVSDDAPTVCRVCCGDVTVRVETYAVTYGDGTVRAVCASDDDAAVIATALAQLAVDDTGTDGRDNRYGIVLPVRVYRCIDGEPDMSAPAYVPTPDMPCPACAAFAVTCPCCGSDDDDIVPDTVRRPRVYRDIDHTVPVVTDNGVFCLRSSDGTAAWHAVVNGRVVAATWHDRGSAEAGVDVERRRDAARRAAAVVPASKAVRS